MMSSNGRTTLAILLPAILAGVLSVDLQVARAQPMTMPPPMSVDDMETTSTPRRQDITTGRSQRGSRQVSYRLASIPKMFGDIFVPSGQLVQTRIDTPSNQPSIFVSDLPFGGARRSKITENDHILPDDRVFFLYNHFHNSLTLQQIPFAAPPAIQQSHVDLYTVGIERMYLDDLASVQVRMPFTSSFDAISGPTMLDGGNIGNVSIVNKFLWYTEETLAIGGGVTVDLPTGSDFNITDGGSAWTLHNSSVHLLPFVGFVAVPDDRMFLQFTAQLDFAANGNALTGTDTVGGERYTEQNLLYLDLNFGKWLYQDPEAEALKGIAAITELHYTSAIQDTDILPVPVPVGAGFLTNFANRFDVLNLTAGLSAQVGLTDLRVAAVVPLRDGLDNRFFDTEVQVQANRRY